MFSALTLVIINKLRLSAINSLIIEIFMLFSKKIAEDLELFYSFFYYRTEPTKGKLP